MDRSQRRSASPAAGGAEADRRDAALGSLSARTRARRRARAIALDLLGAPWLPVAAIEALLCAASPFAGRTRPVRMMRANLELAGRAAGVEDPRALERAVLRHAARQFASWVRLSRSGGPRSKSGAFVLARTRTTPAAEQALQALCAGDGAIVASAHLGEWELLAAYLAHRGVQGGVVGLERRADPASAWLARLRERNGVRTHAHDAPPRALLEELAAGRSVGLLTDLETPRSDQVLLPFLGEPAHCASAPAALARASGRAIVPMVCVHESEGWTIHAEQPIRFDRAVPRGPEERRVLAGLNRVYESWIRRWPEQWAWHQQRWRRQGAARRLLD